MVTKNDCIIVFNAMIRGTPVSFKEKLLPLYSEYLTDNNFEYSDKLINLVVNNPELIEHAIPKIVDYFCRKYNLFRLMIKSNFNLKTILYYE